MPRENAQTLLRRSNEALVLALHLREQLLPCDILWQSIFSISINFSRNCGSALATNVSTFSASVTPAPPRRVCTIVNCFVFEIPSYNLLLTPFVEFYSANKGGMKIWSVTESHARQGVDKCTLQLVDAYPYRHPSLLLVQALTTFATISFSPSDAAELNCPSKAKY